MHALNQAMTPGRSGAAVDSFPNLAVDGHVAWLVMALPVCVLVGLAVVLLFGRRRGGLANEPVSFAGGVEKTAAAEQSGFADGGNIVSGRVPTGTAKRDESQDGQKTGLVKFPTNKGSESALLRLDATRVADVRNRIRSLEGETGVHEELGRLYLELGEFLLEQEPNGREGVALVLRGIALAIKHEDPLLHGQGRMVMAAQAVESGDLAGACEHWQLARELFLTAGLKTPSADIGAHMHRCGCPSDWVLTEF